jgi:hypothetical protein
MLLEAINRRQFRTIVDRLNRDVYDKSFPEQPFFDCQTNVFMMLGFGILAQLLEELGIAVYIGAGRPLGENKGPQSQLPHDVARDAYAGYTAFQIFGFLPIIRIDQRDVGGVGASQPH